MLNTKWVDWGKKGDIMMHDFHYISKNDPQVKEVYSNLLNILYQAQDLVRDKFTFKFTPVGSYSRNMITYEANSNIGFDFDINIEVNDDDENYTAQQIRDTIRNALNKVIAKYGYSHATIKVVDHCRARIVHSCDFAIIHNGSKNGKPMQQYIHFNKVTQTYLWCEQSQGYYMLPQKIEWLQKNGLWQELRDHYRHKKNLNTDPDVHSRTLFAITVQEMCQKHGYYR